MSVSQLAYIIGFGVLAIGTTAYSSDSTGITSGTADKLAHLLIQHHSRLCSIAATYRSYYGNESGHPGSYWRRSIAADRSGRFISDNSHGHNSLLWQLDPMRKILFATKDDANVYEVVNRALLHVGRSSHELKNALHSEMIFQCLCWWPFSDISPPTWEGDVYSLEPILKQGLYRLRPNKVILEGMECYIFDASSSVTLWLACEQPEVIVAIERRTQGRSTPESRIEMGEHCVTSDGIWLPKRIRVIRYDSNAISEVLRKRVVRDRKFIVDKIAVNESVPSTAYDFEVLPGSVTVEYTEAGIEVEPIDDRQAEHFESLTRACRLYTGDTIKKKQASSLVFLIACCLTLSAGGVAAMWHLGALRSGEPTRDAPAPSRL